MCIGSQLRSRRSQFRQFLYGIWTKFWSERNYVEMEMDIERRATAAKTIEGRQPCFVFCFFSLLLFVPINLFVFIIRFNFVWVRLMLFLRVIRCFFFASQRHVCRTSLKFVTIPKSYFLFIFLLALYGYEQTTITAAMTANKSCVIFLPSNGKCDCFNYIVNASNK